MREDGYLAFLKKANREEMGIGDIASEFNVTIGYINESLRNNQFPKYFMKTVHIPRRDKVTGTRVWREQPVRRWKRTDVEQWMQNNFKANDACR